MNPVPFPNALANLTAIRIESTKAPNGTRQSKTSAGCNPTICNKTI